MEIENIGQRDGVAVPQLYVRDQLASVVRPVKELKGFGKVSLKANEKRRVRFDVPTDMLSFTGRDGKRIVEPGKFDVMIGASSSDIRLRTEIEICGDVQSLGKDWRMLSTCTIDPA